MTPSTLGKYQIIRTLGKGGMGCVYEALDPTLDRRVAIKQLGDHVADDPDMVARFMREAKSAAGASHANNVGIYAVEEHDGQAFIVMELVTGESLAENLRREGRLTPLRALEIVRDVAAGLAVAHDRGIVHRDIKPGNIMITDDGRVKLTDFGIAAVLFEQSELTAAGHVLGTPGYMAPEACRGEPIDHRADLFALGIVLYEMLAGVTPFETKSPVEAIQQIAEARMPPIRSLIALDEGLEHLLGDLLTRDPEDRLHDCATLIARIDAYLGGTDETTTASYPAAHEGSDAPDVRIRVRDDREEGGGFPFVTVFAWVAALVLIALVLYPVLTAKKSSGRSDGTETDAPQTREVAHSGSGGSDRSGEGSGTGRPGGPSGGGTAPKLEVDGMINPPDPVPYQGSGETQVVGEEAHADEDKDYLDQEFEAEPPLIGSPSPGRVTEPMPAPDPEPEPDLDTVTTTIRNVALSLDIDPGVRAAARESLEDIVPEDVRLRTGGGGLKSHERLSLHFEEVRIQGPGSLIEGFLILELTTKRRDCPHIVSRLVSFRHPNRENAFRKAIRSMEEPLRAGFEDTDTEGSIALLVTGYRAIGAALEETLTEVLSRGQEIQHACEAEHRVLAGGEEIPVVPGCDRVLLIEVSEIVAERGRRSARMLGSLTVRLYDQERWLGEEIFSLELNLTGFEDDIHKTVSDIRRWLKRNKGLP